MISNILKSVIKQFYDKRHLVKIKYNRVLPFGDYMSDRWEKAKYLGFGEGSSI